MKLEIYYRLGTELVLFIILVFWYLPILSHLPKVLPMNQFAFHFKYWIVFDSTVCLFEFMKLTWVQLQIIELSWLDIGGESEMNQKMSR